MDSFVDRLSPLAAIAMAGGRCAPALPRYNALLLRLISIQAVMAAHQVLSFLSDTYPGPQ